MLLENKTAVVYGAGGAVGGAVARAFAREGARVFLAGRSLAPLQALAGSIHGQGGTAELAQVDALDRDAIEAHADAVTAAAGGIDVAFNAVGVGGLPGTPLVELTLDAFLDPVDKAMRTQFLTATSLGRRMAERGSGVVLTITSLHSHAAIALFGGVSAAFSAVEGLYRSLAAELGPQGVRFICLCSAGSPDAPGMAAVGDRLAERYGMTVEAMAATARNTTLLRRFPLLAEVGNVAAMMASDHASAMTATVANVTCGAVVD